MTSSVARRAFLGGVAGAVFAVASGRAFGQALPNPPVHVPYSPSTKVVSFPTASNDNLAPKQRYIANRTMTKVAIGMKSSGMTLGRTNKVLRVVGKVLGVARVGGPWGLLASVAGGYALSILLEGGINFTFGNSEGDSENIVIPAGSNSTMYYMTYPYYSDVTVLPVGMTMSRNAASSPTGLRVHFRVDYASTETSPSTLAGGWSRTHTQFGVSPGVNRITYTRPVTVSETSSGVVVTMPTAPGSLAVGFASTTAIPNVEADKMQQFLARQALAEDAALNGGLAAFPGYNKAQVIPFSWPLDVPLEAPLTVGDWKADWPAIPSAENPVNHPWELSQNDWDALPTVNPDTGYSSNPNPGTSTDPEGNPLSIPTGPEVEPAGVGELPGFRAFVDPFENLFNPFKAAFSTGEVTCPSMTWPGWTYGGYGSAAPVTITYHCDMIEPFKPVIVAASTALGGWAAVSHIMEA